MRVFTPTICFQRWTSRPSRVVRKPSFPHYAFPERGVNHEHEHATARSADRQNDIAGLALPHLNVPVGTSATHTHQPLLWGGTGVRGGTGSLPRGQRLCP